MKKERGITLIALIVTIIVLLILAGVSIRTLTGDNGILNRAETAKELTEKAIAKEKLQIELINLAGEKMTNIKYNSDKYLTNYLNEKGFEVEEDIVIVDGWQFVIDRTVPKIIDDELGKITEAERLLPTITKLEKQMNGTQIKINIKVRNSEELKVNYSIKEKGAGEDLQKVENITELEHTFSELTPGKEYIITVETKNKYGEDKRTVEIYTTSIRFSQELLKMKVGETKKIEYSIDSEDVNNMAIEWESADETIATVENGEVKALKKGNTTIKAILKDGSNAFAECVIKVIEPLQPVKLIDKGVTNQEILGGWENFASTWNDSYVSDTIVAGCISIAASHQNNIVGMISKNAIDVTEIENISAQVEIEANYPGLTTHIYIGLCSKKDDLPLQFEMYNKESIISDGVKIPCELNVDVSDLEGEYYLKILIIHGSEAIAYSSMGYIYDVIAK